MAELRGLQLSLSEFRERGVQVVAVSPDSVEQNRGVAERHGIEFPILSDAELAVTRAFGIERSKAVNGGSANAHIVVVEHVELEAPPRRLHSNLINGVKEMRIGYEVRREETTTDG